MAVATELADRVISQIEKGKKQSTAAVTVAEDIKNYSTGKRGR